MTRAKKVLGKRQTRSVPAASQKRTIAQGRPRGTHKKFPFEQTRLGFLLKYEMPVVYDIVMKPYINQAFPHPWPQVIELVSRASGDPTYRKPKFRRCMDEYIATGICCKRARILTPDLKAYYESIRKKKMEAFIAGNRNKIKRFKHDLFNNGIKSDLQANDSQ